MLTVRQKIHTVLWVDRLLAGRNYPAELNFIKNSLSSEDVCFDVARIRGLGRTRFEDR